LRENRPDESAAYDVEPMTMSLMGKLFGVPLVIIGSIVAGAILVVLLFGGPAAPQQRTIADILQSLEASSGQKSMGVLLPQEKELWQMALELAKRLEKKDTEISETELPVIADRLAAMIRSELHRVDSPTGTKEEAERRSGRLRFLIHALGHTGRAEAFEPLLEVVQSGREPYVADAIRRLADLRSVAGIEMDRAVEPVIRAMNASSRRETRLVAATALGAICPPNDAHAVCALSAVRLTSEGELAWSASVALAHLGNANGKITLLDMLDRKFWEEGDRYEKIDEAGNVRRYRMPSDRVEVLMAAAIDAASRLDDADLWESVLRLKSDKSAEVRAAALAAEQRRRVRDTKG